MTTSEFNSYFLSEKLDRLKFLLFDQNLARNIDVETYSSLKTKTDYVLDRTQHTIPALLESNELAGLIAEIDQGINSLENYLLDGSQNNLVNLSYYLSGACNRARTFPTPSFNSQFNFASEIISFQETVKAKLDEIQNIKNSLLESLGEVDKSLITENEKLKELEDTIDRTDIIIKATIEAFENDFNSVRSNLETSFEANKASYRSEIEQIKEEIIATSQEHITNLENREEEARRIIGIIGNIGITGNYQQMAISNEETANSLRLLAMAIMLILSTILIYSIWGVSDNSLSWQKALVRILAATILIYPATYATIESNKHRRVANENRRSELELASINPFIEGLAEEQKQRIKESLVEKYFGNTYSNLEPTKEDEVSINIIERIVKLILSAKK